MMSNGAYQQGGGGIMKRGWVVFVAGMGNGDTMLGMVRMMEMMGSMGGMMGPGGQQ